MPLTDYSTNKDFKRFWMPQTSIPPWARSGDFLIPGHRIGCFVQMREGAGLVRLRGQKDSKVRLSKNSQSRETYLSLEFYVFQFFYNWHVPSSPGPTSSDQHQVRENHILSVNCSPGSCRPQRCSGQRTESGIWLLMFGCTIFYISCKVNLLFHVAVSIFLH